METTLVLLKPDAVQRGLTGEVISRFEGRGLKIVGMKLMRMDRAFAGRHYGEHEGKPFFDGLVDFITSGPIVAMALEGLNAVEVVTTRHGGDQPGQLPARHHQGRPGAGDRPEHRTRIGLTGNGKTGAGPVLLR